MRRFQSGWRYRPDFRGFGTLEKLLGAWRAKLGDRRPSFPDGLASSFRRLNTAVNQYFATPQLSYLVGSACACRRGQVRLRVLCTESLRRDLPALAAELGARASHRHSNQRTTRRPRRNATATVSAETAAGGALLVGACLANAQSPEAVRKVLGITLEEESAEAGSLQERVAAAVADESSQID